MTNTISIGRREYVLTPMNAHEATLVMFILEPYVIPLSLKQDSLDKIDALFDAMKERDPSDLFRLLAYMLHVDAEELIHDEVVGSELVHALVEGFVINHLPVLINIAFAMRIVDTGWDDGI